MRALAEAARLFDVVRAFFADAGVHVPSAAEVGLELLDRLQLLAKMSTQVR